MCILMCAVQAVELTLNSTGLSRDFVLFDFPSVVLHTMSIICMMVHAQR